MMLSFFTGGGRSGDDNAMEHDHSPGAISERFKQGARASYLRDWIYGGMDGAVTTFAVVAGVTGANLPVRVILILGFANLIADGLSMAAGNYSSVKSEVDDMKRLRAVEERHIAEVPDGEREELRQILQNKGIEGDALEASVDAISNNKDRWIELMLSEEYGLPTVQRDPLISATSTFFSFMICGLIPLIPYIVGASASFGLATVSCGIAFFLIGAIKSRWSMARWWVSALETTAIGLGAALAAYGIGALLGRLI